MRTPSGAARQRSRPASVFRAHTGQTLRREGGHCPSTQRPPYRVRNFLHADESTDEAATVKQKVARAVTQLPADLEPATTGTADPDK
ncbi:DUF6193 family natural product biosynthesis protein [Streptomyces sp900116325]|uniref:DUF6193 family natural product biosynthesis protein n=1 Tax=Streptomyces sp. 900116325 TaxID=3154295 RepID=A0ABV2UFG2_9ACTN